ncbi:hypothetical protein GRX03_04055 [Halovenus sp. WSH3]|uniref:DUF7978 domain-containing protein n=1 Tax=Halovenus carboxidivorans TaxID=2692199 RepID=A0A6B0TC50_9EURY|nr:hypothetical protein [Halovenus carboxidivorans]MXR50779.1 hypothetical protein [Halovenus carboxidivorans]
MSEHAGSRLGGVRRYVQDAPVVGAVVVGGGSYLLGFALTYLFVLLDGGLDPQSTSESLIGGSGIFQRTQLVGFPRPEPTTLEFVGWVFYNAHFAETVITPRVSGGAAAGQAQTQTAPEAVNLLTAAATQIPSIVYQLVPVALLTAGGYALARTAQLSVSRDIVRIGLGVPTGYVPLALFGTFLFRAVSTAQREGVEVSVTASPSLVAPVTMAVISTLFGIVGLYLGAQSVDSETE